MKPKGLLTHIWFVKAQVNIALKVEEEHIKVWNGNPKGMYHILYDWGFIDPKKSDKNYNIKGKTDTIKMYN